MTKDLRLASLERTDGVEHRHRHDAAEQIYTPRRTRRAVTYCPPSLIIGAVVIVWMASQEGKLSGLFCAVLCATSVHSELHTHTNRTNSSLDWVLSHWAHFTVLRFICAYVLFCV